MEKQGVVVCLGVTPPLQQQYQQNFSCSISRARAGVHLHDDEGKNN